MMSDDFGSTWTDVPPTGFDNPGLNQHFGDFTLHRPWTASTAGSVLITAWDETAAAYFIYESRDAGETWARRGRLYRPDEFRRIDQTVFESEPGLEFFFPWTLGGNFTQLLPGPDPTRLVDPAIPGRYT